VALLIRPLVLRGRGLAWPQPGGLVGIGSSVRHMIGPLEVPAIRLYRSRFINIDDLGVTIASITRARRILEIGCGDGAVAEVLCREFPAASFLGIDVTSAPGRLFGGDRSRARFRSMRSADLLAEAPEPFDLVVIVDVVHHVAENERMALLQDAAAMVAPGGMVVVKEWERGSGLANLAAYAADRYVSGDKTVRFLPGAELRQLIETGLPGFDVVCEARVPPRRNNLLLALRAD
jgi:2-polyprenyl-3-methyl-5-hydroxy-6-metoxy-1,4-benzoquinol methylase